MILSPTLQERTTHVMPREIVLGNGEMLVNLDDCFQIRDLYFPYVGWANHVGGHRCRVGIWAEDAGFAWLDATWKRQVAYQDDTLVTNCAATHAGFGIRLKIVHAVLHDRNVFVTRFKIENLRDTEREVRLFLAQDLRVDESDIGDTVFYSPSARALVHYKRDRYFLFGGLAGKSIPVPEEDAAHLRESVPRASGYRQAAQETEPRLWAGKKSMEDVHIDALLETLVEIGGTDLQIAAGAPPAVRVGGEWEPLPYEDVTPLDVQQMMYGILTDDQIREFERARELDFPYALEKRARFDVRLYREQKSVAATLGLSSLSHKASAINQANTLLGPTQYACGEKEFKGAEGAWRDAEDGQLSMNAIAQGAVDSVAAYTVTVPAQGTQTVRAWVVAGETLEDVSAQQSTLLADGFDRCLDATALHWFGVARTTRPDLDLLPDKVAKLYTRSLLVIRTQADKRGAIIASNDTDILETARAHYSYLWPRDGALVSLALDSAGQRETSRAFFEFCARVLPQDRAALMHKYGPDGTIGASWHPWIVDGEPEIPFQEDGTALVIYALWRHVQMFADTAFAARLWRQFVQPCADFLADYRHPQTGLPLPSWDLWEERRGCHVWTVASAVAALRAASEYARSEGHVSHAERYASAAKETLEAFQTHFWDGDAGRYARMISVAGDGSLVKDMTVDSSAAALFLFQVLPPDDARLAATMQAIGRALWVKAPVGGLARYERDYYFRVSDDFAQVPGNPWIICTLWLADWYCATAKTRAELRPALDLLEWAALCALPTGVLPEQVHPFTSAPLSVAPLTWSHAQFISSASAYLDKLTQFG